MNAPLFFQHAWHTRVLPGLRHAGVWVCVLVLGVSGVVWAQDAANRVVTLQVRAQEGGIYVDAQIDLALPDVVHEALANGIALHFVSTVKIQRERWYWWDAVDVQESRSVRLVFQPLLLRYRVTPLGEGVSQTFQTLPEALSFVGSVAHWRVADAQVLDNSAKKTLTFTFELDRKQLPRLFQLGGEREWKIFLMQEVDLSFTPNEGN